MSQYAYQAYKFALAASGQVNSLEGNICITATEIMSAMILPPIIKRLRELHPAIDIELVASNSTRDLKKREADITLRSFRPTQPDLIIRKVTDCLGHMYASHCYLNKLTKPVTLESLSSLSFIGFNRTELFIEASHKYGINLSQRNFPIIVENHLVHWALVKKALVLV